jgi:2-methylcitrate dehydratase PrpD
MPQVSTITDSVARFVADFSLSSVSEEARSKGVKHMLDTIGCLLAGASSDVSLRLYTYIRASDCGGSVPVFSWGTTVSAETAALVNATLGHALDYDDAVGTRVGHPSAIVVGALLAAGWQEKTDGFRLLEAYIVGVEVVTRISGAMEHGDYGASGNPGWHITGTMGGFAAVAAIAKLRRMDVMQIRMAMGIAASMASGLQRNFGTMTKPLHSGLAARNGLAAVNLAQVGWTADEAVLDGPVSFPALYGSKNARPEDIAASLGNPLVFDDAKLGMNMKLYPCCYGVHRAIEAAQLLKPTFGADPAQVRSIACRVVPSALRPLLKHRPRTGLEGKFSLEYAVAAAILDDEVSFASFTDEAVVRPEAERLMDLIVLSEDESCRYSADGTEMPKTFALGIRGAVEVEIETLAGARHTEKVYLPKGSAGRPLNWDQVRGKFLDCAEEAGLDRSSAQSVFDELTVLEEVEDIRPKLARLRVDPTVSGSRRQLESADGDGWR